MVGTTGGPRYMPMMPRRANPRDEIYDYWKRWITLTPSVLERHLYENAVAYIRHLRATTSPNALDTTDIHIYAPVIA